MILSCHRVFLFLNLTHRKLFMSKRKSNARLRYQEEHQHFIMDNPIPIHGEFNNKKFTKHDIKSIQPMTRHQGDVFNGWGDGVNFTLSGSAGTGKTLIATYLALQDLFEQNGLYKKIVFIRSAVPTREIGFLPGTQEEKMEVYETPYMQIFDFLFKKKQQYKFMKEAGLVEFHSTSFLRGQTFDDCIIILDEAAGLTYHEISTVLTRIGNNTKIVVIGDVKQNDLLYKKNDVSGFAKFLKVSSRIPSMRQVTFNIQDIVRSGFVKEFLIADETFEEEEEFHKSRRQ
jgi:phosphate starvation-inducible PhoH-like protein